MNKTFSLSRIAVPVMAVVFSTSVVAQSLDMEDLDTQIAYSIGVNIGQSLVQQQLLVDLDLDAFIAGLRDLVSEDVKLSEEQMTLAIQTFQDQLMEREQAALEASIAIGETFLAENGQKDGVVTLASGLQYMVLTAAEEGAASPSLSDSVLAHYHGTLTDGTVFDSSVDRGEPAQFGLTQVIAGWTEALQLMKVGDKWRLFLPSALAYGTSSPSPLIPPNSALIFDVEIIEIR